MCKKFFARLFGSKKNPDSVSYRREMAQKIAGHSIRYVTEKINGVEEVRAAADRITLRDNNHDAIAEVLEALVLCD
jgi:hydroxymethylpyrimidine pyrophosphatase-like HAD family hydrolase